MRKLIIPGVLAIVTAAPGHAASLALNNFDAENGGNTALNYSGYSNLVVGLGSTDLIKSGDYGIGCAGGTGACVDLDGTTNNGAQLNTASFAFAANRVYTFSFSLSGNQRNLDSDTFFTGFSFGGSGATLNYYELGGAFGNAQIFQGFTTAGVTTSTDVLGDTPFTTYSIAFSASNSGSFYAFVGTNSTDNIGPVLDNVALTATVPEPASWALMLVGFGLAGTALRRRTVLAA